jgi:3-oxoadipate enol-lactonase
MVGAVGGTVEVRYHSAGVELFAYAQGSGPPLVLLHGSGLASHTTFEDLGDALQGSCRVLACDVRGFGRSVSREPAAHTWDQYADDVVALLDHLKVAAAVVGGYSFGSGVAVALARRFPERVSGLVLAGPGYAGTAVGQTGPQQAVWADGRAFFARARAEGLATVLLATAGSDAEHERLGRSLADHDELSFLAAHEGELATAQPFDELADLESIRVPALVMPVADDAHDPQIAAWYAARLPVATVAIATSSDPPTWAKSILAFLQSL